MSVEPTTTPDYTPDQLSAIAYRSLDVCVVAGPGSGKTTVLVERYRRLIEDRNFDPRHILAMTFTEKAAANMRAKLAAQFRRKPELLRDLESVSWVSTIHGFCMRLLREHAITAGLDPRFTVLSPRESDRLQWECLQGALDEITEQRRGETLEMIEALHAPRLAGDLKDTYDAIRSAGMSITYVGNMPNPGAPGVPRQAIAAELRKLVQDWPSWEITPKQRDEKSRLLHWCADFESAGEGDFASFQFMMESLDLKLNRVPRRVSSAMKEFREALERLTTTALDEHVAPFRAMIFDVLARFDDEYRNRKNARGKVDFNDLERHTIDLLKANPEVAARIRKQFRQVMLDEFQDINGQQAELIRMLRSENVFFAVGDENQSIYGFRHARPEIFRDYRDEVVASDAQSVQLLDNFRSRGAILRFVREIMAEKEGIVDHDLIAGVNFAEKAEPPVEVLKLLDDADDKDAACDRESAWIANRIRSLCGTLQLGKPGETRPAEFRDFAVLCRGGDSMGPILSAFERAGIPYVCGRRQSFLLSREGRDLTALLRVIANPRDSIALATVLRSPLVGLSDDCLLRLRLLAGSLTGGLNTFAHSSPPPIPEPDASKLISFRRNLDRWRQDQPIVPLDLLLSRALSDCGVNWAPATEGPGADIENFLSLARTTGAKMNLSEFLEEIESLADAAGMDAELSDEDQGNCVQVMTAHAAKGLEFNVTIIAAMDKGTRRESGPVTFTPEHGLGLKWRNPALDDGKEGMKDSWAEANKAVASKREADEENRLLYVAMTRAAEHLILSYSCGKSRPSNWAKIVDNHFSLHPPALSFEARREERDGYSASILVTNADPPTTAQRQADSADAEAEILPRPVIEDQHETAVTVTSLAVFGSCPRKYYIQRSLGWNSGRFRRFDPNDISAESDPDDDEDLKASDIGSAVHQILAGLPPAQDSDEARQLAGVFIRSGLGRRVAASPRVEREWAFIADIDGTVVRGTIDLWFEENNELHLVDYKTDAVTAAAAPVRAREYAPQLALYAMALERAMGLRPKAAWLHFLRANIVIEIGLDDATIASARSLISDLRRAQNELHFPLNEGEHCRACQFYRSLCPAGRNAPETKEGGILGIVEPDNYSSVD